jgi:hypothetical protein
LYLLIDLPGLIDFPHLFRYSAREIVRRAAQGLQSVMRIGKLPLTAKQKRFAEGIVLEGLTGADSYRKAYSDKGTPKTIGNNASRLKADSRIQMEMVALEQAKQVAALHSAEALRSLVISSLTSALIDPDTKTATKIQAAKVLGSVTEVAAFTERKEITHVKDSGEIRAQIMSQLKTMMLSADNVQDVDADSLLAEIAGDETHPEGIPPNQDWDSGSHVHTIPHEQSPEISHPSEHPPLSSETQTPGGDIFGENDGVAK